MNQYADILLPLRLPSNLRLLTYAIPPEISDLRCGEAVGVSMGNSEDAPLYTGIVWRLHNDAPEVKRVRPIVKRLYNYPLLSPEQQRFWEWIANYYICRLGEVMKIALPSLVQPRGRDEESFECAEYSPATEWYVSLNPTEERKIAKNAVKQMGALEEIELLAERYSEFPKRLLNIDLATLRALEAKGIITLTCRALTSNNQVDREFNLPKLTDHQRQALDQIIEGHKTRPCALLHGVTGSGKTELYIHMIAKELAASRDVMLLLPEIALTQQLVERISAIFGSRVTCYHSKIPPRKRTETFMQLSNRKGGDAGRLIIGTRSAIFLPLNRLGLIIIDEEHDASYKQQDTAPLYNARDTAHILIAQYGAKLLLGSATPSLESWTNATTGKFTLTRLTERYGGAQMPQIKISDTRRASIRRERRGHFNFDLIRSMELRLERGEQVMLFQNRRGYAPYVECVACGWVARCPHCNVSLTMHKGGGRLECHYCGYATAVVTKCPSCKVGEVQPQGFGTEKIEQQVSELFPDARVMRLDRDTATSQAAFDRIVGGFARHEADILIGTQMIAKGFDFGGVTLVGVLNGDNMLHSPDFRAEERAFSMMLQVAGRAGRRPGSEAEVVIQSGDPKHRILRYVAEDDYDTMARTLIEEREQFNYPPYARLIKISLRDADKPRLTRSANHLSQLLRNRFGGRVRGPIAPPVDRIGRVWIVEFLLKIESGASSMRAREVLREIESEWLKTREHEAIQLTYNADPQ